MRKALKKWGSSCLPLILFAAFAASGEMRLAAADDAVPNAPDAKDWPVPDEQTPVQLWDQIAQQQSWTAAVQTLATTSGAVMFLLAGFALVETGLLGSKCIRRSLLRYFLVFPLAALAFCVYGFALGWGNWFNGPVPPGWVATLGRGLTLLDRGWGIAEDPAQPGIFKYGLLGAKGFCLHGVGDPSVMKLFLLMMNFMITAAAIPIGAMAERWRLKSFLPYGLWVVLPYSIYANWAWAGGWLAQAGLNWGLGPGAWGGRFCRFWRGL